MSIEKSEEIILFCDGNHRCSPVRGTSIKTIVDKFIKLGGKQFILSGDFMVPTICHFCKECAEKIQVDVMLPYNRIYQKTHKIHYPFI